MIKMQKSKEEDFENRNRNVYYFQLFNLNPYLCYVGEQRSRDMHNEVLL